MRWIHSHASDEDLLLLAEDELRPRRRARLRRHLRACPRCAGRSRTLHGELDALAGACRTAGGAEPDPLLSRAALQARLAREPDASFHAGGGPRLWVRGGGRPWHRVRGVGQPQLWGAGGRPRLRWQAAALAAAGLLAAAGTAALLFDPPHGAVPGAALPRPDLTPGAARNVSVAEVCGGAPYAAGPRVAASVARQVFEDYGADYRRAAEYELDFLITPELGGTADARNLWPQPYGETRWNAHVKDELETLFRRLVCDGTIDVSTAQREMATNWIAAYRRWFHTDHPRGADHRRDG